MTRFFHLDDLARDRAAQGKRYLEFLRVPAMSAGVYVLAEGASDPQKPHHEDELYYVVRGRARMQIGSDHAEVRAGSLIFVEAEREHRFYDIREELEYWFSSPPQNRNKAIGSNQPWGCWTRPCEDALLPGSPNPRPREPGA